MVPPLGQLLLVVLIPKLLSSFNVTEKLKLESFWMNFCFHGPKTSSILVTLLIIGFAILELGVIRI